MYTTTVSVVRPSSGANSKLATGIQVQVDQASLNEVVAHQQIADHEVGDLFKIYTLWWPAVLIQRGDQLQDEQFTDPQTGAAILYRVTGRVKVFRNDHQECYAVVRPGR